MQVGLLVSLLRGKPILFFLAELLLCLRVALLKPLGLDVTFLLCKVTCSLRTFYCLPGTAKSPRLHCPRCPCLGFNISLALCFALLNIYYVLHIGGHIPFGSPRVSKATGTDPALKIRLRCVHTCSVIRKILRSLNISKPCYTKVFKVFVVLSLGRDSFIYFAPVVFWSFYALTRAKQIVLNLLVIRALLCSSFSSFPLFRGLNTLTRAKQIVLNLLVIRALRCLALVNLFTEIACATYTLARAKQVVLTLLPIRALRCFSGVYLIPIILRSRNPFTRPHLKLLEITRVNPCANSEFSRLVFLSVQSRDACLCASGSGKCAGVLLEAPDILYVCKLIWSKVSKAFAFILFVRLSRSSLCATKKTLEVVF